MKKARILVADDEYGSREAFRMILKDDHAILTANKGKEALRQVKKEKVDLVILDIIMPDLDGIEVLKRIKEIDPKIKVIMVTATKNVKNAQEALELGAFDYITKPFDVDNIRLVIQRALKDH